MFPLQMQFCTTSDVYISEVTKGDDKGKYNVYAVIKTERHGSLKCQFVTDEPEQFEIMQEGVFSINMVGRFRTYEARGNTTYSADEFVIDDPMQVYDLAKQMLTIKKQAQVQAEQAMSKPAPSANGTSRKKAPAKKASDDS
ncbi:MAG: hypothetical protein AAFV93_01940 [Chloroflexota bacterium]